MAEMAETACSDTAYLGYEYPAFAGHSFADTLANHAPHCPAVSDATAASEIPLAAISGDNGGSTDSISDGHIGSDARDSTGGNIIGDSDDHALPDANEIGHDAGHDIGHDVGHGLNNEDDIEVDNVC